MQTEFMKNVGPDAIDVAYQRFGDVTHPPVLLIMGGGAQMISWPDEFCMALVSNGLQPIRFDNRDTGLTTHFTSSPIPDLSAVMQGDYSSVSYTLSDMAADTVAFIDALGFDAVHLVGASMGGMIAQTIAIEHPQHVKSLTSIMSTTGNSGVGQPDYSVFSKLGAPPGDREGYINWRVKSLRAIGSDVFPFDEEGSAAIAGLSWDRDHDPLAMLRQSVAVLKSGDRSELLKTITVPTLVIHGKADKMLHVSGGIATSELVPGAKLMLFDGMGHGLPKLLFPEIAVAIASLVKEAEHSAIVI